MKNIRFTYGPSRFRFVGMYDPSDSDDHWKPFDFDYSDADVTGPKILRYHDLCLEEAAFERAGRSRSWSSVPLRGSFNTSVKKGVVDTLGLVDHRILKGPIENGATLVSWTDVRDHARPTVTTATSVDNVGLAASCGAYPAGSIAAMDALVAQMNVRRTVLTKDVTDLAGLVFAPDQNGLYLFLTSHGVHDGTDESSNPWIVRGSKSYSSSRTGSWTNSCDDPPGSSHTYPATDTSDDDAVIFSASSGVSALYVPFTGYEGWTVKYHYVPYTDTDARGCVSTYTESTETRTESVSGAVLTGNPRTLTFPVSGLPPARFSSGEAQSMLDMSDVKVLVSVTWPSEYDNPNTTRVWIYQMMSAHTQYMNGDVKAVSVPASLRLDSGSGRFVVDVTIAPSVFNGLVVQSKFNSGEDKREHPVDQLHSDWTSLEWTNAWRCDMTVLGIAIKYNPREKPVT